MANNSSIEIAYTNEFLKELNNNYFEEEANVCPINFLPFDENAIYLPCTHKFNYRPLFNYIYDIKKTVNKYNTIKLFKNEIMCPLCRKVFPQLLPFVPHGDITQRVYEVTSPSKYSMDHKTCDKILIHGKNKGKACGKVGYHTEYGNLCERHDNVMKKRKTQKDTVMLMTMVNSPIPVNYTVKQLKNILRQNNLTVSGNKTCLINRILSNNIQING